LKFELAGIETAAGVRPTNNHRCGCILNCLLQKVILVGLSALVKKNVYADGAGAGMVSRRDP